MYLMRKFQSRLIWFIICTVNGLILWRANPDNINVCNNLASYDFSNMIIITGAVYYRPPTKLREGNVFSPLVSHSVQRGVSCGHYLHWASLHRDVGTHYAGAPVVTSSGQDWRPLQTYSLEGPIVLPSGGYWSKYDRLKWACWNAFLFHVIFTSTGILVPVIFDKQTTKLWSIFF